MDCSSDEMNQKLVEEAYAAMKHAYAPYSHFRVGAALLTKEGKIIGWEQHFLQRMEPYILAVILKMLRTVQPTVRSVRQFLKRYRKGIRRLSGLPSYHRPIRKRRHAASADRYWQSL